MTPLCNFAQSKALKSLGYNWDTKAGYAENEDGTYEEWHDREWELNRLDVYPYMDDYKAPTIPDAIRFFRIEKGMHGHVFPVFSGTLKWGYGIVDIAEFIAKKQDEPPYFSTYDQAESALLDRLIELTTAKQD